MVRSWYATPKWSATTFLRSSRRHRTTPWTLRSGAGLDDLSEFGQLRLLQPGRMTLGADVAQPVGAERVEVVTQSRRV